MPNKREEGKCGKGREFRKSRVFWFQPPRSTTKNQLGLNKEQKEVRAFSPNLPSSPLSSNKQICQQASTNCQSEQDGWKSAVGLM